MTQKLIEILFITFGILMIIVIYRLVLRRLSKGRVIHSDFCTLYSLEKNPVNDTVEFYFTTPVSQHIRFCIWKENEEFIELKNEDVPKGGHIIRFDSRTLENGLYTFGLVTKKQKTIKKFEIRN